MVNVELKVKHFCLISYVLLKDQAGLSFSMLEKIKTACTNKADDDITTVESDASFFITVFRKLSNQPEGEFATSNDEMYALLVPQVQNGVANNDPDWINLATEIDAVRTTNQQSISSYINYAKLKLDL
jgi:hypothetical protein